jgi:hypothetical protein
MDQRTHTIRSLNDALRTTFDGGSVIVTPGVQNLAKETRAMALAAVQGFDSFDETNDPYGEHDFGAFEINGHNLFWKIDYYDLTLGYRSPDPADPSKTVRVLTVMLAEEY